MPIYEYQCKSCGFEFETIQKISEDPLKGCPECGLEELRKLVSKAAFRLKGGGWYETDFKSGSKKNVAGSDSSSTSDSGGASGSGSKSADAKPKTDTKPKSDTASKGGSTSSSTGSSSSSK